MSLEPLKQEIIQSVNKSSALPLPELPQGVDDLSRGSRYLVFCRTGRLGVVAAMLLRERGIEAVSLRGDVKERSDETAI